MNCEYIVFDNDIYMVQESHVSLFTSVDKNEFIRKYNRAKIDE